MSSNRKSYYPYNQPVTTVARTSESREDQLTSTQLQTNTIQPTATIAERTLAERSLAGSPVPEVNNIPLVATYSGYP